LASRLPLEMPIGLSVTLRGKPLQWRSWRRVCRTAPWIKRLSGMTWPTLTGVHGVGWRISFLRASRASLSVSQGSGEGQQTKDGSGPTSPESLEKSSPQSYFLRTSQDSLPLDCGPSSRVLPRWGSMRSGIVFERPTLARRIGGNGSSSWPTARAEDSESCGNHPRNEGDSLTGIARLWKTPTAEDCQNREFARNNRGEPKLSAQAKWATPAARDWKNETAHPHGQHSPQLGRQVLQANGAASRELCGPPRLNPLFVEWLMGFPCGWTSFAPLEMESFRQWQRTHSGLLWKG